MKARFIRGSKILLDKVKDSDRYSRVITFTYNDKNSFGTVFGGLVSFVTYLILALYAYVILRIMFEKNGTPKLLFYEK